MTMGAVWKEVQDDDAEDDEESSLSAVVLHVGRVSVRFEHRL
jgi:hypothetical protein